METVYKEHSKSIPWEQRRSRDEFPQILNLAQTSLPNSQQSLVELEESFDKIQAELEERNM